MQWCQKIFSLSTWICRCEFCEISAQDCFCSGFRKCPGHINPHKPRHADLPAFEMVLSLSTFSSSTYTISYYLRLLHPAHHQIHPPSPLFVSSIAHNAPPISRRSPGPSYHLPRTQHPIGRPSTGMLPRGST